MSTSFDIQLGDRMTGVITATAAQTALPVNFPFQTAAELIVLKQDLAGTVSTLVLTTNYTVTGAGVSAGGTVTLNVGATAGEKFVVLGAAKVERRSNMTAAGRYSPAALESDLDKLTIIGQELLRQNKFTLRGGPFGGPVAELSAAQVTRLVTIAAGGEVAVPAASLAQARAGLDNAAFMTSQRVRQSLGPEYTITDAPAAVAASAMGINYYWKDSAAYSLINEGALWSAKTYTAFGFHKEFTAANTPGAGNGTLTGGPCTALFAFANNNGSSGDVCAIIGDVNVASASGTGFAANFLARNEAVNGTKLVGVEIDVMPALGTTISAASAALIYNVFNISSAACISLAGGVNGGTWANGHLTSRIRGAHYGVNAGDPTTADSFIDCRNGTFGVAFKTGTGASMGMQFGAGNFAASPFLWAPTTTDLAIKPGTSGFFIAYRPDGSTQNITLNPFGVLNFPNNGAIQISGLQVLNQRETGWTAMAGTATKGGFDTSTVTLPQLAQVVKALTDRGIGAGFIGA